MKRVACTLLCALLFAPASEGATLPPTAVAHNFYAWAMTVGGGIPSSQELLRARGLLSARFSELLRASLGAEERCVKATPPDLKPPIFEGNLFVDNYEGLTKVLSLTQKRQHGKTIVSAHLAYAEPGSPAHVYKWTDRLTLVMENGKWVIDDSGAKSSLSATLKKYTSKEECGI
jgi:hypothetical protein